MPRWAWVVGTVLAAAGVAAPAGAQPLPPGDPPPAARREATPDHPPAVLGAPVAVPGYPVRSAPEFPASEPAAPLPTSGSGRVALGMPSVAGQEPVGAVVPAGAAETVRVARTDRPAAGESVNDFLAYRAGSPAEKREKADREPAREPVTHTAGSWSDRLTGVLGERGEWFRSDHAFDGFISPVTNPFLFEDPRSLTEVRPIYLYQRIPGRQADTNGGNIQYFGVQGRVAITNRLSFTINKLGGTWFNPQSGSALPGSSGFSEIWLGPKFTFIRGEESGTLLAGGLQFQIPIGSAGVFQNTGALSLVPYVSYAQSFLRDASWGGVNLMANASYAFSTNSARSDYLSLSGHLDWDVMNWHRFYPLLEMNYYLMTTDGTTRPNVGAEGRDLFNLGSSAKGNGLLTGAFGARFKFTECAQVGTAFEIPFAGPKDFFQYRWTLDFIYRY